MDLREKDGPAVEAVGSAGDSSAAETLTNAAADHWESGMHLALGSDRFDSCLRYQRRLTGESQRLAAEFGFATVAARRSIDEGQGQLGTHLAQYLRKLNHRTGSQKSPANSTEPPSLCKA